MFFHAAEEVPINRGQSMSAERIVVEAHRDIFQIRLGVAVGHGDARRSARVCGTREIATGALFSGLIPGKPQGGT